MVSRTLFFSFLVFLLVLLLPAFEGSMTSALDGRRGRSPPSSSSSPAPARGNSTEFIRASCGATLYPRLCYASLAAYADSVAESPVALARLAANVTAARLRALSARVAALRRRRAASPREAAALRDCCESAGDAADLARRAGAELACLDGGAGEGGAAAAAGWRVANAQTWLSAALTDEETCADGFDAVAPAPGSAKGEVLARVRTTKQYTSNALALVNTLVAA